MRRGGHLPDEAASGDPLAELARLIGQSDPFSDYGRRDGRNPPPRDAHSRDTQPQSGSDWRRQAASMPPYDAPDEAPRAPSRSEPRFTEAYSNREPYRATEERQDLRQDTRQDTRQDLRQDLRQDRQDLRQEPRLDPRYDPRYEERSSQYRRDSQYEEEGYDDPRHDDRHHDDPRHDDRMYGGRDQHSQPGYFDDGAPLDEDEDPYDDPPRSRRRGGLFTAVTLIGCAMIGTAGAYGYRTYYSAPGSNRVPPVISADTTPTKVVSAAEGPSGKSIQDRVRDTAERVIPREEEPVELRTPSSSSRGFPQSGFPSGGSGNSGANAFAPPSGNNANASDSKRVRTLTIRPEEATGRTASNNTPPPNAAPPRPTPVPKTAPSRNPPPVSLDPQEPVAPPPAPRERTAVVAPPPAPTQNLSPPAPRAPASEGSASGYAVQLSSQRSEAEAQASYRSLQSKYPDQLSDRSVMIKRVDLGPKGVYYRALVGPFASSDEASQLCSDLKAAGGQCLIQRN